MKPTPEDFKKIYEEHGNQIIDEIFKDITKNFVRIDDLNLGDKVTFETNSVVINDDGIYWTESTKGIQNIIQKMNKDI